MLQQPGVASPWEQHAGIAELAQIAETADELGFEYLTCAEHVAIPHEDAERRGSTYWDPATTLAYLAARTRRIRLLTSVIVLGYHHPLALAKQYGNLDMISGGRLVLGVGVGSLAPEFELLDAPWADRGPRANDALRALRAGLSTRVPSYSGEYYRFADMIVEPHAVQSHVPIWVGGRTLRSLRRSRDLADGWMPFGLNRHEIAAMLARVDLPDDFHIALPSGRPLDPLDDAAGTQRRLETLRELGATTATVSLTADSCTHYCEQLAALREIAASVDPENTIDSTRENL